MSENQEPNQLYNCGDWIEIGKRLYLDAETADVHFAFDLEDGTVNRIAAHKNILASASDVFRTMFYGESKMDQDADVQVDDVSDAAFMEFLQFFYRTQIQLTIENIAGVMQLGHKYNVPNCIKVGIQFLKDVLTVDNVFIGVNLGIRYDLRDLLELCSKFITLNTAAILKTAGFLGCDKSALQFVLSMGLFSCSEIDVFRACMAWVQSKSKNNALTKATVKKHLGDLYHEIRFASMTMHELCSLQAEYEPVLRNDFSTIANMIVLPAFRADIFNNEPRNAKWNADVNAVVVGDFKVKNSNESQHDFWNNHTITFSTTDIPLLLGSFVCGKVRVKTRDVPYSRDLSLPLPVKVEIMEVSNSSGANDKQLVATNASLQSIDANETVLPHPILIRPGFQYKICIGPFPDQHVYYSKELMMKACVSNDSDFFSFYASYVKLHNVSNNNGKPFGLISMLKFNKF